MFVRLDAKTLRRINAARRDRTDRHPLYASIGERVIARQMYESERQRDQDDGEPTWPESNENHD